MRLYLFLNLNGLESWSSSINFDPDRNQDQNYYLHFNKINNRLFNLERLRQDLTLNDLQAINQVNIDVSFNA